MIQMSIRSFLKAGGLHNQALEETIEILDRELISAQQLADESLTSTDFQEIGVLDEAREAIRKAAEAVQVPHKAEF